ncbi:unnamed protein product [Alopecurus aequalis]
MASKASASCSLLLFLALNLILFAVTSACPTCGGSGNNGGHGGSGGGGYGGGGGSGHGGGGGGYGGGSGGSGGSTGGGGGIIGGSPGGGIIGGGPGGTIGGGPGGGIIGGGPGGGIIGGGSGGGGGGYGGGGSGGGTSGWYGKCPTDALKLHVCANVLDLIKAKVGVPPLNDRCCPLLNGLVDLDAAVCLCTAIKADVLGIHLNLPIHLSLILNFCGKGVPTGFMCPT